MVGSVRQRNHSKGCGQSYQGLLSVSGFHVMSGFYLFIFFPSCCDRVLPWQGTHSLFNKSHRHKNTTDNFSSFEVNLISGLPLVPLPHFRSDIKTSHQYFITRQLSALCGQLTFPGCLIPVSFEEKNKTPCNQQSHPHKRNEDISSKTGSGPEGRRRYPYPVTLGIKNSRRGRRGWGLELEAKRKPWLNRPIRFLKKTKVELTALLFIIKYITFKN